MISGIISGIKNGLKDQDLQVAIASNQVTGVQKRVIFGVNNDVDSNNEEDIWDFGGTQVFFDSGRILNISSDDPADVGNVMIIEGADSGNFWQMEIVILNGTTPVSTTQEFFRVRSGTIVNTTNVGNVYIYDSTGGGQSGGTPNDSDDVQGYIVPGVGATRSSLVNIPKDRFIIFNRSDTTTGKDNEMNITQKIRLDPFDLDSVITPAQLNLYRIQLVLDVEVPFGPNIDSWNPVTAAANNSKISIGFDVTEIDLNNNGLGISL